MVGQAQACRQTPEQGLPFGKLPEALSLARRMHVDGDWLDH